MTFFHLRLYIYYSVDYQVSDIILLTKKINPLAYVLIPVIEVSAAWY